MYYYIFFLKFYITYNPPSFKLYSIYVYNIYITNYNIHNKYGYSVIIRADVFYMSKKPIKYACSHIKL